MKNSPASTVYIRDPIAHNMKVLVISSLFPSKASPTSGIFIKEQLKEIKKWCSVICVISPTPWHLSIKKLGQRNNDNDRPREEDWEDNRIYRPRYFMIPKITVYLNGFFYFLSVYILIKRKKELANFDIIHVHFAYPAGFAAALIGKILKKPVVLTVRGTDINYFPTDPVLKIIIRYSLNRITKIIAVSDNLKRKVSNLNIKCNKIEVVPNGVDLNLFKAIDKGSVRKKLGINDHNKVILYVGAFEKVKGLEFLLRAYKEILKSYVFNEATLILIGTGSITKKIKRMIWDYDIYDHVLLKKYIKHEEIPLWMNASDVFCLPSLNEGRPNVLYEAIACGTPVVATNVGGVSEIIVSDELGELIPSKSVNDIINALTRVLKKEWNIKRIRNYAIQHSTSRYAEKIVDIYKKCMSISRVKGEVTL